MDLKNFVLLILIGIVKAKISLEVSVGQYKISDLFKQNISISYSGFETNIITADDIKTFKIEDMNLIDAVKQHLGKKPNNVYLKSPTPWGDLYKTYGWEQVKRVLSINAARMKNFVKKPVVILSQDFENTSSKTIKVNTGISHEVENTITTTWSKEKEITVSQEIEYDFNVIFGKMMGNTAFSYTSKWGVSEEKTESQTIGTTTGMETELQPGQAVTAVLSASTGFIEIEVVHKAFLRGNLALNFKRAYRGHHFWGPLIQDVMKTKGISNEITTVETIKFGFHVDSSLIVYDKVTGKPV